MDSATKKENDDGVDEATSFDIQCCSDDGRLLTEYRLTRIRDNVATLDAAEDHIRSDLSDYKGEPLVIIVSQESLTKFHQLQVQVVASTPDAA